MEMEEEEGQEELNFEQVSNQFPGLLDYFSLDGFDSQSFERFAEDFFWTK